MAWSFPGWVYEYTPANSTMGVVQWSVENQNGTWKDFIWRMSQRMGFTELSFDFSETFAGTSLGSTFAEIGKAKVTLSNRGFDTWQDTCFKACLWAKMYPSDAAAELFNMTWGLSHGFEGEYSGAPGGSPYMGSHAGGSAFGAAQSGIFKVGDMPAGTHAYNSIRRRTDRGPGREAHYGDPGLHPHGLGPLVILGIVVVSVAALSFIISRVIDYLKHALTLEHIEVMADKGYEVEFTGSRDEMGFDASEGGTGAYSAYTGMNLKTTRTTTAQNQSAGAGASNVRTVNPITIVTLVGGTTGETATDTSMQDNTPDETKKEMPVAALGIGALAYFFI